MSETKTEARRRSTAGELEILTDGERGAVAALLRADPRRAIRLCCVQERALGRAAAGMGIRPGTAKLIRDGLATGRWEASR